MIGGGCWGFLRSLSLLRGLGWWWWFEASGGEREKPIIEENEERLRIVRFRYCTIRELITEITKRRALFSLFSHLHHTGALECLQKSHPPPQRHFFYLLNIHKRVKPIWAKDDATFSVASLL